MKKHLMDHHIKELERYKSDVQKEDNKEED